MNRLLRWSPIVVGALGLAATLAWMYRDRLFPDAAPPVATVEKTPGGLRAGLPLAVGSTVSQGDAITQEGRYSSTLRLPSGEQVELRDDTSVELMKLSSRAGCELWLHQGTLRLRGDDRRSGAIVYTHEATAVGSKARYQIVAADGATTIRVARGEVRVRGLHDTVATVAARQSLRIERGEHPQPATPQPDPFGPPLDD